LLQRSGSDLRAILLCRFTADRPDLAIAPGAMRRETARSFPSSRVQAQVDFLCCGGIDTAELPWRAGRSRQPARGAGRRRGSFAQS